MYSACNHSFVICAYGESIYLEECIKSLFAQTVKSNVIVATSTPNEHIIGLCRKYNLELFVNSNRDGISSDWNFAISCATTGLVTLAHQDDIYKPCYTEYMLKALNAAKNPLIFSCGYGELRGTEEVYSNRLLNIKKLLLIPMRAFPQSIAARRLSLSFGSPICCPSVTYIRNIIGNNRFKANYYADLDWEQWETLSKNKGSFVYCSKPLVLHRIHEESETSKVIGSTGRKNEDYQMFLHFWPKQIAKILSEVYSKAENSNKL